MKFNNQTILNYLVATDVLKSYNDKMDEYSFNCFEYFKFTEESNQYLKNIKNKTESHQDKSIESLDILINFVNVWNNIKKNLDVELSKKSIQRLYQTTTKINYFNRFTDELKKTENSFEIDISKHPELLYSFINIFKSINGIDTTNKFREACLLAVIPEKELISFFQNEGRFVKKIMFFEAIQCKALTAFVKDEKNSNEDKEKYIETNMNPQMHSSWYGGKSSSIILNAIGNYIDLNYSQGKSLYSLKEEFHKNDNLHAFVESKKLNTFLLKKYLSITGKENHVEKFDLDCQPAFYSFTFQIPNEMDKEINLSSTRKKFLRECFLVCLDKYFTSKENGNFAIVKKTNINLDDNSIQIFSQTNQELQKLINVFSQDNSSIVNHLLPTILNEVRVRPANELTNGDVKVVSAISYSIFEKLMIGQKIDDVFNSKFQTEKNAAVSDTKIDTTFKI